MKKIYQFHCYCLLILILCIGISAKSQNFKLTDIDRIKNSYPSNNQYGKGQAYAYLNGYFYFTADDGIHGQELFRSDGTGNGTQLVKDINPGTASSIVSSITVSGGKLYFNTYDKNFNQYMWVSDGTENGTQLLANMPHASYGYFSLLTDVSGSLYFIYYYYYASQSFNALWKTDASGLAGVMVAPLNGNVQQMVGANGRLFFSYYDYNSTNGNELYTSDGTAAGTGLIANINPAPNVGSNPFHLTPINGLLYFAADDGSGNRLWVSDGTGSGTHLVKNNDNVILAADGRYGSDFFGVRNSTLFFQGSVAKGLPATGDELCKYNTADPAGNIVFVKDILSGKASSMPTSFTSGKSSLFFTTSTGNHNSQLWKTDGTEDGTVLVKDIDTGQKNFIYNLVNANGTLLFTYGNDALGNELWKSDGSSAGTVLVKDIYPGPAGSSPNFITSGGDVTLFGASSAAGNELWRTNGTSEGTNMVKDINKTTTSDAYPKGFAAIADKVVFTAYNGLSPSNLYVSEGPKSIVKIIDSSVTVSSLFGGYEAYDVEKSFVPFKEYNYFVDFNNRLFKTNGTKAGTSQIPVPAFGNRDSSFVIDLFAAGNLLYLVNFEFITNKSNLWRTDGTAAGTYILKSDLTSFNNIYPTAIGNTLYFSNVDNNVGSQLWKTNGTVAGTVVIKTIGSHNYNPLAYLHNFKNKLYFNAYAASGTGPYLWTSDGTDPGTVVLKDISLIQQSFAEANGKLFFYGHDDATSFGDELYATDGTAAGTKLMKDINPYGSSFSRFASSSIVSGKKIIYFMATDGFNGPALWKSDGTPGGTTMIKDGMPGYYIGKANSNDHLYFITFDNTVWESDGTTANTHPINDQSLNGLTNMNNFAAINNKLYLSAYTYASGQELYIANTGLETPVSAKKTLPAIVNSNPLGTLQIKLSPDPVINSLQVTLNGFQPNTPVTISVISSSGALLKTQQSKGSDQAVSLDVASLPAGMYILKVESGGNVRYSQFVKIQ